MSKRAMKLFGFILLPLTLLAQTATESYSFKPRSREKLLSAIANQHESRPVKWVTGVGISHQLQRRLS